MGGHLLDACAIDRCFSEIEDRPPLRRTRYGMCWMRCGRATSVPAREIGLDRSPVNSLLVSTPAVSTARRSRAHSPSCS